MSRIVYVVIEHTVRRPRVRLLRPISEVADLLFGGPEPWRGGVTKRALRCIARFIVFCLMLDGIAADLLPSASWWVILLAGGVANAMTAFGYDSMRKPWL